jgi:hypothetical protein
VPCVCTGGVSIGHWTAGHLVAGQHVPAAAAGMLTCLYSAACWKCCTSLTRHTRLLVPAAGLTSATPMGQRRSCRPQLAPWFWRRQHAHPLSGPCPTGTAASPPRPAHQLGSLAHIVWKMVAGAAVCWAVLLACTAAARSAAGRGSWDAPCPVHGHAFVCNHLHDRTGTTVSRQQSQ